MSIFKDCLSKKYFRSSFWLIILVYYNLSCVNSKSKPDEFQFVIEHYSEKPQDSLKLKAARFLIENLDGLMTLDTNSVSTNNVYFNLLDSLYPNRSKSLHWSFPELAITIDSFNKVNQLKPVSPNATYIKENKIITADFLINNIDKAFYVWQTMPWAKHISFKDFCEYILPYRTTDTYSLHSREYFLSKYHLLLDSLRESSNSFYVGSKIIKDLDKDFAEDVYVLMRYPYLVPIKFDDLFKGHFGTCEDANSIRVTALRSLGIPAAMDEIPNWGNQNSSHYNYKIIDPTNDTIKSLITNKNIKKETQHIFSASSYDVADYKDVPKYAQINYLRSIPKVYRRMFSKQSTSLAWIANENDDIPPYFKNIRLKDVSREYLEASDVKLKLKPVSTERFAYLCVFDNQEWKPVAWAPVHNDIATFSDMGKNIIYLPVYFSQGRYYPAGDPFLLNNQGEVKPIKAHIKNRELITAYAKFPARTYIIRRLSFMIGGRFQLANKADLSDSVTVHRINKLPFFQTTVRVSNTNKYRYFIYQFKGVPATYIAEIAFYGLNIKGKEVKLKGKLIGNPGLYPYTYENLINGKREDVYKPKKEDSTTYVGIDLGENNFTRLTKIVFNPYSDDNSVVENDVYELFYWNGNWKSLGLSKGTINNSVTFKNVPKNSLLLMKDLRGGTQDRIFTYKGGRAIFW